MSAPTFPGVPGTPHLAPVDARTGDWASASWSLWSTEATLVVTDPAALSGALHLARTELDTIEAAISRFRHDSELSELNAAAAAAGRGGPAVSRQVSQPFAEALKRSLELSRLTSGAMDPTVGSDLVRWGYDIDIDELHLLGAPAAPGRTPQNGRITHADVRVDGRLVSVPPGTVLDLGAVGKAWAADEVARKLHLACGCGVMLSLGGDIAMCGPAPEGGWQLTVDDGPGQPACSVTGPLHAALSIWTMSYRNSWSMILHDQGNMLLHTAVLGATPVADAVSVDAWLRKRANAPLPHAGTSWVYSLPIRGMQLTTATHYFLAGVAKICGPMGLQWGDGEVLRRQIMADGMRKELLGTKASGLGVQLTRTPVLFTTMATGSLVLELAAPIALVDKRVAQVWAVGAWSMHVGILLIMGIKFRHNLTGVLYQPYFDMEKVLPPAWR